MKSLAVTMAAFVLTAAAGAAQAQDPWRPHSAEVAAVDPAVRAPLEAYLKGHATGDPAQFRTAFHDEALVWLFRGDSLVRWSDDDYISRAGTGQPAADEAQRRRWIESIQVHGDTATAVIILDYPAVRFVDDMQLMRVSGRWMIVSKMAQGRPKAPAS